MNNIDDFVIWSGKNNNNTIFFNNNKKSIEKYSHFVCESSHNVIHSVLLQECQSFILKKGKNKEWKKFMTSLRMSLYGQLRKLLRVFINATAISGFL